MNEWITAKWNWYTALPWYFKVLFFAVGIVLLMLLGLAAISRGKNIIQTSGSDFVHDVFVEEEKDKAEKKDEELDKEIKESKKKIEEIREEEKEIDTKADDAIDRIENAKSSDEIREILKEFGQ